MKIPLKTTYFLALCAVLTAALILPGRIQAEEDDRAEEGAAATQSDDKGSSEGQLSTEAGAPTMDAPAPPAAKRAERRHKPVKARAMPRDGGGGGGGGGGGRDDREDPQDEPESTPAPMPTPRGTPAPDTLNCDMPPLHHINVHFMGGNGNRLRADSTPIVCSTDPGTKHERYCQKTMNDNNRRCCPAKPEGHPMRVPCELLLLGKDPSDGVPGPNWQYVGNDPNGGIEKHGENPFLAYAYGSGIARACSNVVNVCGEATYKVK